MTSLAQNARIQRAREQFDSYQFRQVTIAGHVAVYVTAPPVKGSQSVYTVCFGGRHPRCNCPDYLRECRGTLATCKHITMAEEFRGGRRPRTVAELLEQSIPEVRPGVVFLKEVICDQHWSERGDPFAEDDEPAPPAKPAGPAGDSIAERLTHAERLRAQCLAQRQWLEDEDRIAAELADVDRRILTLRRMATDFPDDGF